MDRGRLEAFSDGVVTIIITIGVGRYAAEVPRWES
jgi:hypothetical protein